MTTVVVTGAAGFIGVNFVRYLIGNTSWRIIGVDSLSEASNLASLEGIDQSRFRFEKVDIRDLNALLEVSEGADAMVHLAAESHNDNSLHSPGLFIETNVVGTFNVLEVVRTLKLRLHHVSTDEVYGDFPPGSVDLFKEETPYRPSSPYSATKAASDHLVRAWVRSFKIEATISNCSNNYGPYQNVEKFIPRQITNLLLGEKAVLYGTGNNVRDWIHVNDHSSAILRILESGKLGETYLVGTSGERDNLSVVEIIMDVMGFPASHLRFIADRAGHDFRYGIDSSKMRKDLAWNPEPRDFREDISQLVEWYRENETWWRAKKTSIEEKYAREQE